MITLTFRPIYAESPVLVRAMHFRVCADATLRGSDNAIAARYSAAIWRLGHHQYRAFECDGPVYLRVTNSDGSREHLGPYDFIKIAEGAVFTHDSCLGIHASGADLSALTAVWQEFAILSEG